MEKVDEHEEKTIEEARNSVESDKEDEGIRSTITERFGPVDSTKEGSMDPSKSHSHTVKDHDVVEYEMEDEEVWELFRRNSGVRPEAAERNNFQYLNKSEGMMVLQYQEDTPEETEQADVVFHSFDDNNEIPDLEAVNLNSQDILEGVKSSSASKEATEDSSSDSDLDSNLSRYYFDGSLPVSAHVEESETYQDEYPAPEGENKIPLLCPKQPMQQSTSWRTCCGLLALLRAAEP